MILENPLIQAGCAALAAGIVVVVRLFRGKPVLGTGGKFLPVAIAAGFSVPKGLFLCSYILYPDPPEVLTKLHGYEMEISTAGAMIIFFALSSVWSLCVRKAE